MSGETGTEDAGVEAELITAGANEMGREGTEEEEDEEGSPVLALFAAAFCFRSSKRTGLP